MVYMSASFFWVVSFFFLKQKTAYEMRISDWSSDVCSSDLSATPGKSPRHERVARGAFMPSPPVSPAPHLPFPRSPDCPSCRRTRPRRRSATTASLPPQAPCPGSPSRTHRPSPTRPPSPPTSLYTHPRRSPLQYWHSPL